MQAIMVDYIVQNSEACPGTKEGREMHARRHTNTCSPGCMCTHLSVEDTHPNTGVYVIHVLHTKVHPFTNEWRQQWQEQGWVKWWFQEVNIGPGVTLVVVVMVDVHYYHSKFSLM